MNKTLTPEEQIRNRNLYHVLAQVFGHDVSDETADDKDERMTAFLAKMPPLPPMPPELSTRTLTPEELDRIAYDTMVGIFGQNASVQLQLADGKSKDEGMNALLAQMSPETQKKIRSHARKFHTTGWLMGDGVVTCRPCGEEFRVADSA